MLSKKVEAALGKQINHELSNFYAYMAAEAWFEEANFKGFAHWMKVQWGEELVHARKFFDYVHDRAGTVDLAPIAKAAGGFKSVKDVFAKAVALEEATTKAINELNALAGGEGDYATQSMLKWFIDEQVEEEKTAGEALAKIEMAGDSKGTLLMLDHQFAKRGEK